MQLAYSTAPQPIGSQYILGGGWDAVGIFYSPPPQLTGQVCIGDDIANIFSDFLPICIFSIIDFMLTFFSITVVETIFGVKKQNMLFS